jgi:hypothetical protein
VRNSRWNFLLGIFFVTKRFDKRSPVDIQYSLETLRFGQRLPLKNDDRKIISQILGQIQSSILESEMSLKGQSSEILTLWWTKNIFLSFSMKVLEKVPLYEKIAH